MGERHKPSGAGVGHGLSKSSVRDPHGGPTPGDASFRYYFTTPEAYQEAMARAAKLEAKGMHRRAWRVRLNLDGEQPRYTPIRKPLTDEDEGEEPRLIVQPTSSIPALKIEKWIPPPPPPPKFAADPEVVKKLIKQTQLSHQKIANELGVKKQAVTNWNKGAGITRENFDKLELFVKKLRG